MVAFNINIFLDRPENINLLSYIIRDKPQQLSTPQQLFTPQQLSIPQQLTTPQQLSTGVSNGLTFIVQVY